MSDLDVLRAAGLRTGRYASFKPEFGTPVRTSVGRPKFWSHGVLPHARTCSPYGVFGRNDLTGAEWKAAYLARLDHLQDRVVAELAAIARSHPGQPLVLLCYEAEPSECHRSLLAEWLADRFDLDAAEVVPDMGTTSADAEPPQGRLW